MLSVLYTACYNEVEIPSEFDYEIGIETLNLTVKKYQKKISGKCEIKLHLTSHLAVICWSDDVIK